MAKAYPIFVTPLPEEEGGCFLAVIPDLKGCMSHGDTQEEAVKNVLQAGQEWAEEARRLGRQVPEPFTFAKEAMEQRHQQLQTLINEVERLRCALQDMTERAEAQPFAFAIVNHLQGPTSEDRVH